MLQALIKRQLGQGIVSLSVMKKLHDNNALLFLTAIGRYTINERKERIYNYTLTIAYRVTHSK